MMEEIKGILCFPDAQFSGVMFGNLDLKDLSKNIVMGEFVFNTSMTGYQEILTDPSYAGQVVVFTSAQIGNTGFNPLDFEHASMIAKGAIISNRVQVPHHFENTGNLNDFLMSQKKIGLQSVDTRALTLYLREKGVCEGVILPAELQSKAPEYLEKLKKENYGSIDWILRVSREREQVYAPIGEKKYRIAAFDFGIKQRLIEEFRNRGCEVVVVPAETSAKRIHDLKVDGVFLSNGPGDPMHATYAVNAVRELLGTTPIFGVCMGHQILGLALGAKTYKMKYGHRGGNQPVQGPRGSVEISSHNHGYAVDPKTLPDFAKETHRNLNDGCCEGLEVVGKRAFSVQYHPESSPGPHDSGYLFDQFLGMISSG